MHTALQPLTSMLHTIPAPSFIIEVLENGSFVYRGLNKALKETSGLNEVDLVGYTPQDCFPKRTADTVVANYQECLTRQVPVHYEEVLNLPVGPRWWRTSLSPISHKGSLVGIFGVTMDCTTSKHIECNYMQALETLSSLNARMARLIDISIGSVTKPLQDARRTFDVVLDGFKDLGDNKKQIIEGSAGRLDAVLEQVEHYLDEAKNLGAHQTSAHNLPIATLHLERWCRHIMALHDPTGAIECHVPDAMIECETLLAECVLSALLEVACREARRSIVIELNQRGPFIQCVVRHDGIPLGETEAYGTTPGENHDIVVPAAVLSATRLLTARGGEIWYDKPIGDFVGASYAFHLHGRILDEDDVRSEGLTHMI